MKVVTTSLLLVVGVFLVACGLSQAEQDAQATQIAANIFATQTAEAPTATPTLVPPTATPTPVPPTATPALFAHEGHWETVGNSNSPVSFDVTADGMVHNFRILIGGKCDVRVNRAFPIGADHVFVIGEVDAEGNPVNNGIVGIFDSPTTVTGSFANPWRCGTASAYQETYFPSALTTWEAEWKKP